MSIFNTIGQFIGVSARPVVRLTSDDGIAETTFEGKNLNQNDFSLSS
jgi:hypothetical protein